jgi:hypothetical protein
VPSRGGLTPRLPPTSIILNETLSEWPGTSLPASVTAAPMSGWIPLSGPLSQPRQTQTSSIRGAPALLKSVAWSVAPVALCLFSSVTVSVMMFPLFTVVRSSGFLGCMLPQALFAARMVSDFGGRVLASARQPSLRLVGVRAYHLLVRTAVFGMMEHFSHCVRSRGLFCRIGIRTIRRSLLDSCALE